MIKRLWQTGRTRIVLISLLYVSALLVLLLAFRYYNYTRNNPLYQGRRLSVWLKELWNAENEKDPAKRRQSVEAIQAIGTNAMPQLLHLLTNRESVLKHRAVQWMLRRQIRVPSNWTIVDNSNVRALAGFRVLAKQHPEIVPELARRLEDPGANVEILRALDQFGSEANVAILRALEHPNAHIRRQAAVLLGYRKKPREEAVTALLKALKDPKGTVRAMAANALASFPEGGRRIVPALIEVLDDKDKEVREFAALALGHFGEAGKIALPKLKEAAVRKTIDEASEAIRRIDLKLWREMYPPVTNQNGVVENR